MFAYRPHSSLMVIQFGTAVDTDDVLDAVAHLYGSPFRPAPPAVGQLRARLCDDGSCQHYHAGRVCLVCTHPAHAAATRLRMAVPPDSAP